MQATQLLKHLMHFIYPAACYGCGSLLFDDQQLLCRLCNALVLPIASLELDLTASRTMTVFAAGEYIDPLRKIILQKQYGNRHASRTLGHFIAQRVEINHLKPGLFVPVPLHWTRYAHRGFNQAHIIAQALSQRTTIPTYNMMCRTRRTAYQASLSAGARLANVTNIFAIRKSYEDRAKTLIEGKHIVLVDDLCTTGSTLVSLAKFLSTYRPAQISALVACRVL